MNDPTAAPDLRTLLRLAGGDETVPDGGGRSGLLEDVVRAATDVAPGMLGCSLTEMDGPRMTTSVMSADLCRDLDELQYREGTGPCVRAARDRQRQYVRFMDEEPASNFAQHALERGVRSVLSVPVQSPLRPTGLNLYNGVVDGFDQRLYVERAELLSRAISAILIGRRPGAESVVGLPMGTRELVVGARAAVMEEHGWNSADAFDWMVRTSAAQHRSLFAVAAEITDGAVHE